MTTTLKIWLAAAGAALLLAYAANSLTNIPSDQELAEATAASLLDAQAQAEQEAPRNRTNEQIAQSVCGKLHGDLAQILMIDGKYVCRGLA